MSKTLVAYYSHKGQNYFSGNIRSISKGNTEYVAEFIRDAVGADIFEIDTVKPYSDDYKQCCNEAYAELKSGARPELKVNLDSIDGYDNIVICGPCWSGTYPMAVFTFIDSFDWTGKKVFAVVTHEGSGFGKTQKDLEKACSGATFGKGLTVFGGDSAGSSCVVSEWAKGNLL